MATIIKRGDSDKALGRELGVDTGTRRGDEYSGDKIKIGDVWRCLEMIGDVWRR